MTSTAPRADTITGRSAGYVIAAAINALLLYLINVRPGWEAVAFLSDDTGLVLGIVNLSLAVGVVANLVYLVAWAGWVRPLGDVVTTAVSLAALVRVWQVFPFAFGDQSFDWALLFRILLGVGIFGTAVGLLVYAATFFRRAAP